MKEFVAMQTDSTQKIPTKLTINPLNNVFGFSDTAITRRIDIHVSHHIEEMVEVIDFDRVSLAAAILRGHKFFHRPSATTSN